MDNLIYLEDVRFRRERERWSFQRLAGEYEFYERRLEEGSLEPDWREIYERRFKILKSLMGIEAVG